jgi:hypothetical protein
MAKEVKMTIEKAPIDIDGKLEQRQKLAEMLEKKLIDFKNEIETKCYLIEGKTQTAKDILEFITVKAKWSFTEAMGVIEVIKQLESSIKELESGKRKELMLNAVGLEATYYFMSKETGVGLSEAKHFFNNLIKPVSEALNRAKIDRDKRDQMERDLASIQAAIDTGAISEVEEKFLLEIEAEHAV